MLTLFLKSGLPLPHKNQLDPNTVFRHFPKFLKTRGRLHFELAGATVLSFSAHVARLLRRASSVDSRRGTRLLSLPGLTCDGNIKSHPS
jgi:hypothetical protein